MRSYVRLVEPVPSLCNGIATVRPLFPVDFRIEYIRSLDRYGLATKEKGEWKYKDYTFHTAKEADTFMAINCKRGSNARQ